MSSDALLDSPTLPPAFQSNPIETRRTDVASETIDMRKWAAAYLTGRIRGYARHNLTLRSVETAVALALRYGVPSGAVNDALHQGGFRLEAGQLRTPDE